MTDLLNSIWDQPFAAITGHDHLSAVEIGEGLYGAYAETDVDSPEDQVVFGVDYELAFEIQSDHLHDSLYLGTLTRDDNGARVSIEHEGQTILFDEDYDADEVPLDHSKIAALMQDYFRELLALDRYGLPKTMIDGIYVEVSCADGNRFDITMGVPQDVTGTVGEVFEKYINPFFGAITNGTDPGTFNHSYWASEASRAIEQAAA